MNWLFYDFVKATAAPGLLIGYRPKVLYEGGEKIRVKTGMMVVANHIGMTDPMYVMAGLWYRRIRFVCLKSFFEHRVSRFFFTGFRCIPIDRDNVGMDTFREIVEAMKADQAVAIFPGGHVEHAGSAIEEFKAGMVLMALQAKKPIVPVYLKRRARWYERLRIAVGQPIDIVARYGERPKMSEIEEIARLVLEKEEELKAMTD